MSDIAFLGTHGIQDPNTRNFLDRFLQVWKQKMSGPDAFVSKTEFADLTADVLSQALVGNSGGIGGLPAAGAVSAAIDNLTQSIRGSLVQQVLEDNVQPRIERMLKVTGDQISSESQVRNTQISSLASAINRVWALIGGSTAVIQDGNIASATPSSAVATKWNSVIAAVTDPNTGNVSSAAILTETRAYANSADSTFNAIYSVKASVSAAGQTVVGGFALAATGGAGSAQGPTIDFGVLANRFYIAAPSSGYSPASEYTTNPNFPFIVVTTPTTINGVTYAPGVYMKRAAIGNAAIGSAQIQDAAITNAKISGAITSNDWNGVSTGWAIDKSSNAWFFNIFARGDIQATSLTANTVYTENIVGAAVTQSYSVLGNGDSGSGGSHLYATVSVPAGTSSITVFGYSGYAYIVETDTYIPYEAIVGVNGVGEIVGRTFSMFTLPTPAAGTYVCYIRNSDGSMIPKQLLVMLNKR